MANREQRSSREKRKPKAEKPKATSTQASPFARTSGGGNPKGGTTKKDR